MSALRYSHWLYLFSEGQQSDALEETRNGDCLKSFLMRQKLEIYVPE
jgi:hypothetical protein